MTEVPLCWCLRATPAVFLSYTVRKSLYLMMHFFFPPRRFSERPRHVPPMPPQTQALPARAAVRGPVLRPLALPPQHQRLADRHGHVPEDRQEAGQLLQRHHLQQQAHRRVRAGSAEGKPKTKAGHGKSRFGAVFSIRTSEKRKN